MAAPRRRNHLLGGFHGPGSGASRRRAATRRPLAAVVCATAAAWLGSAALAQAPDLEWAVVHDDSLWSPPRADPQERLLHTGFLSSGGDTAALVWRQSPDGDFVELFRLESGSGDAIGTDVWVWPDGDFSLLGEFRGTVDFDPGPGNTSRFAGAGAWGGFLSRYDSEGTFLEVLTIDGSDVGPRSIAADGHGAVYVAGDFDGSIDLDPGPATTFESSVNSASDVFALKAAPGGNGEWGLALGDSGFDQLAGLVVRSDASVVLAGRFFGVIDADPQAGVFPLDSEGEQASFVIALSPTGALLWAKVLRGSDFTRAAALASDGAGGLLVVGSFRGTTDFDPGDGSFPMTGANPGGNNCFVLSLDASGGFEWALSFTGDSTGCNAVATDSLRNAYVGGSFWGTVQLDPDDGTAELTSRGQTDAFLLKLDPTGRFGWVARFGGPDVDEVTHIAVLPSLDLVVKGEFRGTSDFDPGPGEHLLTADRFGSGFTLRLAAIDVPAPAVPTASRWLLGVLGALLATAGLGASRAPR